MALKVAIFDQQHLYAVALKGIISEVDDAADCTTHSDIDSGMLLIAQSKVDLVILDPAVGETGMTDVFQHIARLQARTQVLVLTSSFDLVIATRCLRAGVRGFLLKTHPVEELKLAIKRVSSGSVYFCSQIQEFQLRLLSDENLSTYLLSAREKEVMEYLIQDKSPKEIAAFLRVSRKTIDTHKRNLFQKLGVQTLGQLTRYAIKNGVIKL
jgi:DNA-binding NarL/FixJ family response regulator